MLPNMPKAFNVFMEDESWVGRFTEVGVGKVTRKMEDYRGGGMPGNVKVDLGYEMPEIEVTLAEYTPSIIRKWGECEHDGVLMRLLSGTQNDGPGCKVDHVEMVIRGRPMEYDFGSWKPGDLTNTKVQLVTSYFKFQINDDTLIELDPVNMIEVVGGIDRFEKLRAAIAV